jgi:hypothetical protein
MTARHQALPSGPPGPRICGRCRRIFAGDATLPLDLDSGWWACPPCAEQLIGRGAFATPSWPAQGAR